MEYIDMYKQTINTWKTMIKAKNHYILCIYLKTICMDGQCLQDCLKLKTNMSTFDEVRITNYDENSDKGYIIEVTIDYPKDLHNLHSDLPFLPKRMKINKCNNCMQSI